jgi:hypothetical protein
MTGVAAIVLMAATTTFAQAPNLAGKWTREAAAADPAGGGGGGRGGRGGGGGGVFNCGQSCEIVQTAKTLTIKRAPNAEGVAPPDIVLNLDGSPSKLTQPGRGGAEPTTYEAIAKVEGGKIIVTRQLQMQDQAVTITQTIALDGGKLTVTSSGRQGGTPTTITYVKG